MSLGPVMLDLEGTALTPEERDLLRHPAVGGVILFSRNYESPEQISGLNKEIHGLRQPHLLIAVDQEGGRVQRFREGFSQLPPAAWYGEKYRASPSHAFELAEFGGWLMASELRTTGVDFSFAPVLDLATGVSSVIGDRAFDSRPLVVSELAHAWARGARRAGMASVGKHFPGHGSVKEDSHDELPVDDRSFEDILMRDLVPFERMIHYGLEAVMPAHLVVTAVDRELAGFSRTWLRKVLRGRLEFQGVIFSDDLNMQATHDAGGFEDRARAALDAGCDMVLVCNNRGGAVEVVESLVDYTDPAAQLRLLRMHGRKSLTRTDLHLDPRWNKAVQAIASFEESNALSLDL